MERFKTRHIPLLSQTEPKSVHHSCRCARGNREYTVMFIYTSSDRGSSAKSVTKYHLRSHSSTEPTKLDNFRSVP